MRDALVDANRLRRMDRFGRSGVVAGSRALAAAGVRAAPSGSPPAPRFGVVVGTAYGCRDAITQHERLLASAARVEDLAPSVFAATVHNTVGGELAILYGLGGIAETLVSGRTAGLEALALAASRVGKGDADRVLVVAAEGIDDTMREAWARENPGRQRSSRRLRRCSWRGSRRKKEEISSSQRERTALFIEAALTFDPAAGRETPEERREDFSEGAGAREARGGRGAVIERPGAPGIERLGASGLWEIAEDLSELAASAARPAGPSGAPAADAPQPHTPSKKIRIHRYVVRDVHGSRASVTLAFFS